MSFKQTKTGKSIYQKSEGVSLTRSYLFSAQLVLAILLCLYLCSLTLSAHQLHHSLQKVSSDGLLSISMERLDRFSNEKQLINNARETERDKLNSKRNEIAQLFSTISEKKNEIIKMKAETSTVDVERDAIMMVAVVSAEEAILERLENELFRNRCALVKSAIEVDNDYVSSLDNLFEQTGLGTSKEPVENDNSIQLALAGYVSLYDDLKEAEGCSFPEIRRLKSYNIADKQLTQMLAEYRYFNPIETGILPFEDPIKKNVIKMPRSMLTIMVVLLMGALGGLITLVRALISDSDEKVTVSYKAFLFTPILGAVTGFAIFVLAKAGVLIISDAGSEGGAYLSPFFVSFLGLISGLLSVDALDTMTELGKKWFSSSKGVVRWCVVGTEISSDSKRVAVLARLAGVRDEVFLDWVDGKKAVPEIGQKIIAASLNKEQGSLFTDIQPQEELPNQSQGVSTDHGQ